MLCWVAFRVPAGLFRKLPALSPLIALKRAAVFSTHPGFLTSVVNGETYLKLRTHPSSSKPSKGHYLESSINGASLSDERGNRNAMTPSERGQ